MEDFSDDGFDDLNLAVLQELESKALQAVQPGNASRGGGAVPVDDDLDQADAEALRQLARVPAQHALGGRLAAAAAPPPLRLPAYSQSDLVNVPLPAARDAGKNSAFYPRAPQQRPSVATGRQASGVAARPAGAGLSLGAGGGPGRVPAALSAIDSKATTTTTTTSNRGGMGSGADAGAAGVGLGTAAAAAESASVAELQARVRMLETDLYTAQGKASMMQNKYETVQRKLEAEVLRVQKQKDEELERQRQRADAAVAAHKSVATELEFAIQDLKEEVEKSKKGRRADRAEAPTTPRKGAAARSNWNVADGFEDVELLPSPSKGFSRRLKDAGGATVPSAVERTPTKGKRRRPITGSPSLPLETLAVEDADVLGTGPGPSTARQQSTQPPLDQPFVFIQEVLGHRSAPGEPTTIDLFSRYSFPSNRKQTLAFLMLQRIPQLEGRQGTTWLMLEFCQLILGIWSQCMREAYHAPVRSLVSLLEYIIRRDPAGLARHILEALLPIAQETIYLVAEPAFDSPSGNLSNHPDYAVRQMASDIDAGATMSLLRLIAYGCLTQPQSDDPAQTQCQPSQASTMATAMSVSAQRWFWSKVQFEFVLLMLSSKQPPEVFLGMLSLLRTSVLPDSIGPITNDPAKDAGVVASMIIDRISHHIKEPPKWATPSKYTEWDMRLAALGVLDCFAQSPFGRLSLAASDCALPRLVGVLFPAYGELRARDVLDEPLDPPDDLLVLSDAEIRAYGIGGFDLAQTLVPGLDSTGTTGAVAGNVAAATSQHSGMPRPVLDDGSGGNPIPLVLLYVSTTVYLLHSIATDPYTSAVANIPAKLAGARRGMQGFYLLTMARLGFRIDPAFAVGLGEDTCKLAMDLFTLAATPEEGQDFAEWARQDQGSGVSPGRTGAERKDPFSDEALGDLQLHHADRVVVKTEHSVS